MLLIHVLIDVLRAFLLEWIILYEYLLWIIKLSLIRRKVRKNSEHDILESKYRQVGFLDVKHMVFEIIFDFGNAF